MIKKTITLSSTDFINYSQPIELLPQLEQSEFYNVFKIIWKYKFNTSSFDYNDKILFTIGDERIATMQHDILSSASSVACISHANLCIDKECPKVALSEKLYLKLLGTPPTQGNGSVVVEIYYSIEDIDRITTY